MHRYTLHKNSAFQCYRIELYIFLSVNFLPVCPLESWKSCFGVTVLIETFIPMLVPVGIELGVHTQETV